MTNNLVLRLYRPQIENLENRIATIVDLLNTADPDLIERIVFGEEYDLIPDDNIQEREGEDVWIVPALSRYNTQTGEEFHTYYGDMASAKYALGEYVVREVFTL